jgi:AraC-like DNA-binding protein
VEQTATSIYREYPAPAALKSHLMCLWTQAIVGSGEPYAHRVLPDGCIDLVFIDDDPPVVVGPYVESFIARLSPGTTIVGARFRPGRAAALLGHPASALLNQSVALDDLWRHGACLISNETGAARLAALEAALICRMPYAAPPDPAVTAAIDWLAGHPECSVEELGQYMGMSSRQLRRRFTAAVGYSPKVFQEVLRFQALLNLADRRREQVRLAELAVDAGYADQAHMTREVHRFSDTQPTNLLGSGRCTLRLSGLIVT